MHKALGQDVRDGLILRNVTEAVKVPQVRHKGIEPLSAEETKKLLAAAREERFEALYVLAVTTGLREGELPVLSSGATWTWKAGCCASGARSPESRAATLWASPRPPGAVGARA
ncbi:hypothetical protein [Rubrobacter xylanophilus]|uniref:hypothetical protein n=1 Tax=Rubrobacter xylanophilus TaxID=49319 RepID=UPI00155A9B33|nr:hypothetical protein [Rubrobacter xylanophilus]